MIGVVAAALSVQPDRAARLLEALDIIGGSLDQVRLVRVFQGEQGPHGAVSRGEFHYVIDRVAGPPRRRRDDRGDRGGRGGDRDRGGGGRGGPGERRDKPRGLGSLKAGAQKEAPKDDDRPGRGEMPRAGIGWQLTAAPRDFGGGGGDRGRGDRRPRRGGPGGPRGPGGPGGPGGGPGGPGGDRGDRRDRGRTRGPRPGGPFEPRLGPDGQPLPRPPRPPREDRPHQGRPEQQPRLGPDGQPLPPREQQPRLGPDGQPLPPRPRRERKPLGPDANGLGPDGTPWDPERRAKRRAERDAQPHSPLNADQAAPVEAPAPPAVVEPALDAPPEE
jgi:hypothetical protein